MRGLRAIGLSALLATLCLMLSAAGAQALGRSFWGITDTSGASGRDFSKMHHAKVGVARIGFYEQQIEISPGVFDWSTTDGFVGGLASRGITTLPELLV